MKQTDETIKYFKEARISTNQNKDNAVFNKMLDAANTNKPSANRLNTWRIIMKSRITKSAVAAVIIIAVLTGIYQLTGSIDGASVAFALDDVLEVLKHVDNKHMIMKTSQPPATYEFWTKYSQNGDVLAERIESPEGRLTIATDGVSYSYIPAFDSHTNEIIAEESKVFINSTKKINDPVMYVEQMASIVAEQGGTVTKQFENNEETGERVLSMTITLKDIPVKKGKLGDMEAKMIFDIETKLPIRAQEYRIENGQKLHKADYEFYYNEELPEDLFTFDIPDGIQVIDRRETGN